MCQVTSMQSMVLFVNLKQKSLTSMERHLLNWQSFRSYHKCITIRPQKPGLRWVTPEPFIFSGNVLVYTSTAGGINAACAVRTWQRMKPAGLLRPAVGRLGQQEPVFALGHATVFRRDISAH